MFRRGGGNPYAECDDDDDDETMEEEATTIDKTTTMGGDQKLKALVSHKLIDMVKYSEDAECFTRKLMVRGEETWVKCSGLLPSLKRVFWSNYEYVQSAYGEGGGGGGGGGGVRSRMQGLMRGSLVHEQLRSYINMDDISRFKAEHPRLHPFTSTAIAAMQAFRLRPLIAELPIVDPELGIATAIDAICMDTVDNKLVIIDWKCGMADYMMRGNKPMRGFLGKKYSNCPLHQGYLQLLFTRAILRKYYGVTVDNLILMQLKHDSASTAQHEQTGKWNEFVQPYQLLPEWIAQEDRIYEYLAERHRNWSQRRRTKNTQRSGLRYYGQSSSSSAATKGRKTKRPSKKADPLPSSSSSSGFRF
jgi:hypothetical protein